MPRLSDTALTDALRIGNPDAPLSITIYEDYLCPACATWDRRHRDRLTRACAAGAAVVHYKPVHMMATRSNPPGYSLQAASALVSAALRGQLVTFRRALLDHAPAEIRQARVTMNPEIVPHLASQVSLTGGDFTHEVATTAYRDAIEANFAELREQWADPNGAVFVPTVVANGHQIDVSPASNTLQEMLSDVSS
ncbi:thioredoxin domain-containing protein [Longimycelium tulufanense]|uniref:thioredoxin domain-containing protein n=1 Tax=Longimycelium tulufanense TaxID=907463 RepID=UPI00166A0DBC|nr:thioredoxin domain-containing protein [Longimycelium tulufanense]